MFDLHNPGHILGGGAVHDALHVLVVAAHDEGVVLRRHLHGHLDGHLVLGEGERERGEEQGSGTQ